MLKYKKSIIAFSLVAFFLVAEIYGRSGFCYKEFQVLTPNQIVARYFVGEEWSQLSATERKKVFSTKMKIIESVDDLYANRSIFGAYKYTISFYFSSGKRMLVPLSVCGVPNGSSTTIDQSIKSITGTNANKISSSFLENDKLWK